MPYPGRTASDWRRIREIFVRRRAVYGVEEVSELLRIPAAAVQEAIGTGVVTALGTGSDVAIGWEDVVVLGLEHRWTPRMLTEALRGAGIHALPPLIRVLSRRVALPSYQWKLLGLIAARRSQAEEREITVSDLLEEAISTAVVTPIEDWSTLEASQPGLRAAAWWPGEEDADFR